MSLGSSILPCLRALNTTICSRSAANWAGEKPSPLGGACADGGFSGACTTGTWPRTAAAQLAGNIRACSSTAASESRRGQANTGRRAAALAAAAADAPCYSAGRLAAAGPAASFDGVPSGLSRPSPAVEAPRREGRLEQRVPHLAMALWRGDPVSMCLCLALCLEAGWAGHTKGTRLSRCGTAVLERP